MNAPTLASTLESRRQLRLEQRDVNDALLANRDKLSEVSGLSLLAQLRARNEALFTKVDHAREQLNDVLNLRELARASNTQAERLSESAFGYDFDAFARELQGRFVDREDVHGLFHWEKMGREAGSLFCGAPAVTALRGCLMKPIKHRAVAQRAVKEHSEAVKPIDVQHDTSAKKSGDAQVESTNERVNFLFGHFHRQSQERRVDLLRLLVDPADPVQTVENFFDFGFLVKTKRVAMEAVGGEPMCRETDPDAVVNQQSSQVILSIDMRDLRDVKEMNLLGDSACSLHREDELYRASSALEQAKIIEDRDVAERSLPRAAKSEPSAARSATSAGKKKRPLAARASSAGDGDGENGNAKKENKKLNTLCKGDNTRGLA